MRTHVLAAAALAFTLSLSSCATPGYDQDTAQRLHEHIVAISDASAAGDWQGALDGLETMAAELSKARELGKVDDDRFDTITLAMERVRLDLEAAIAAAANEAERQRLLDEQARLQEQISRLQNQGDAEQQAGDGEAEQQGDDEKSDTGGKGKDKSEGDAED